MAMSEVIFDRTELYEITRILRRDPLMRGEAIRKRNILLNIIAKTSLSSEDQTLALFHLNFSPADSHSRALSDHSLGCQFPSVHTLPERLH